MGPFHANRWAMKILAQRRPPPQDQDTYEVVCAVGDVASVYGLPLLDQALLKVQSIPEACATLLQSYITGGDAEPWKVRHIDDELFGGMGGQFLFPDYSRWNRDGFYHLPTRKAVAGLPIREGFLLRLESGYSLVAAYNS